MQRRACSCVRSRPQRPGGGSWNDRAHHVDLHFAGQRKEWRFGRGLCTALSEGLKMSGVSIQR